MLQHGACLLAEHVKKRMMGRNPQKLPHAKDNDMARTLNITLRKAQGIPGQYQVGYNPKTHKLFVSGSFNHSHIHGSTVATIARINPDTLAIEALAKLPIVPEEHPQVAGQYYVQSPYGLALDNRDGNVWVGGTNTDSVMVYRQEDFSPVWNSRDADIKITHPRELYVDESGVVYVTGVDGYRTVEPDTYLVWDQTFETPSLPLGPIANEATRELYLPDILNNKILVVNLQNWAVERIFDVSPQEYKSLPVNAHGVEVNPHRGEIYISAQGVQGRNSGVYVLNTEGEFLDYIPFGNTPTDILLDQRRGLLYVTDFGSVRSPEPSGGTVTIIEAASRRVLTSVRVSETKPNHQVLLSDGSIVIVDKAEEYKNVEVPFHLDPATGEYTVSAVDQHPGEADRAIHADSVVRLSVDVQGSEEPALAETFTPVPRIYREHAGACAEILAEIPQGEPVEIVGSGWNRRSGKEQKNGSTVVIEADDAEVARCEVPLTPFGAFLLAEIPFPESWNAGEEHVFTLRSGHEEGDTERTLELPVRVAAPTGPLERPQDDDADVTVTRETVPFSGYPALPF